MFRVLAFTLFLLASQSLRLEHSHNNYQQNVMHSQQNTSKSSSQTKSNNTANVTTTSAVTKETNTSATITKVQKHIRDQLKAGQHNHTNKDGNLIDRKVVAAAPAPSVPKCADNQIYNKTEQKCVTVQKDTVCSAGNVYDQKIKQCRIFCSEHQHYSYKQQKCLANSLACQRDQKYSRKNKKCVKIDRNCKPGLVFNQKSLLCKKVVKCASDEEVNPRWQICEKKKVVCPKGQALDQKSNTCVFKKFITNPYHDKLSYVGDFKNYVRYYNTAKRIDKLLTDCPFRKPFYQKSTDSCIQCPDNAPIFDLTSDKCIACKYNEVYNAYEHKCMDEKLHFDSPISMWRMNL